MNPRQLLSLTLILAFIPSLAAAETRTASELLEEAIYTEDTVGDVEAAAALYERIVADADLHSDQQAEAQYRLALAQLKQGKRVAAMDSLRKLIRDFPQATDLAEKARRFLPEDVVLETMPWSDGERLEYGIELPGGREIGALVLTACCIPRNPGT